MTIAKRKFEPEVVGMYILKTIMFLKIGWRKINNFRYADDTPLMAESEEEIKSLLMRVKEENEKAGLKLSVKKAKIMASSWCHHLMANRREKMEAENKMSLLGL